MPVSKDVTAKAPKVGSEATVVVQYAETLEEAKEMFGEEAVLSNAFANWRVTLQANIRSKLTSGKTPEQVAEELATAKMGVAATGGKVDTTAAFMAKFKAADENEKAELIKMLTDAAESG